MWQIIMSSDFTIGRDKLFATIINNRNNLDLESILTYVLRLHFDSLNYKSIAYVHKGNRPTKENKFKGVYCDDRINGNFISTKLNQKWFADISCI